MERMQFNPGDRQWTGMGDRQEVTPTRQEHANTDFTQRISYATKSQTHLWTVVLVHNATAQMLEAFSDADPSNVPLLDADTLAMPPAIMCYICSEPYEPRLRLRKCKGDPDQ